MHRSWKTTVGGILVSIGGALQSIEGDVWRAIGALFLAVGGIFLTQARDANVTSEGEHVKKEPK